MSRPMVRAAGGVLWRGDPTSPKVALVHRPRYDDWSLPKGKSKTNEHLLVTAIREVTEETGFRATIGPRLTTVRYRVVTGGRLADKTVTYWAMRCADGSFSPNREVDEIRWLTLAAARRQLTAATDRTVLDAFLRASRDTQPLLLVRHGATHPVARRSRRTSTRRDLSRLGREQAAALVPVLSALGATQLMSADVPACTEMLRPYGVTAGLAVLADAQLARRGFEGNESLIADRLRRDSSDGLLVVCGTQRVISGLVSTFAHGSPARPPHDAVVKKGGWWLLHHEDGAVRAFERHDPAA